ncbi:MAG TPA: prolipoprotein diacylglyceryl transferase [Terriglobales bacterium]
MFPRLFHLGSFSIPTYGVLVATGVLVGLWISVRNSEKQGIKPENAWDFGIALVLAGILGAKVLYIILDWRSGHIYGQNLREIFTFDTLQAGGVFSGGLVAAFIVAWWFLRKHHMPALATCDGFAPGLAMGHAIGRLGCFAAGCCYGKPTNHFWGVTFNNPLAAQLVGTPLGHALEPTQLFESAAELGIFFILTWMFKRKRFDGQIFGAYLFLYGIARFCLEFIRDDPGRGSVFGGVLSGTQLIAIGLVLAGGLIWYLRPTPKVVLATATR